ncbi:hypothetical protein SEEA7571_09774, partial [Salmonella enterica subsp. enterica serovar Agona str. 266757-1]
TAIFKKELVRMYGLFAYMYPPNQGGMRTTDRDSTQKTPGAFLNRACSGPEGARPRDGLSSGAASWTDD